MFRHPEKCKLKCQLVRQRATTSELPHFLVHTLWINRHFLRATTTIPVSPSYLVEIMLLCLGNAYQRAKHNCIAAACASCCLRVFGDNEFRVSTSAPCNIFRTMLTVGQMWRENKFTIAVDSASASANLVLIMYSVHTVFGVLQLTPTALYRLYK